MYPNNYPGTAPTQPGLLSHPQADPWSGEISGLPSTVEVPQLNMAHGLTDAVITTPQNRDEAYMGSLKAMLRNNVGNHIVASFLVGNQNIMSWEGILYDVGNNYLTIYQEPRGRYIVSDLYSLKFMEFYEPDRQPHGSPAPQLGVWPPAMQNGV